ncbi:MAG: filamentous hemagglutinin N-terminal domain-containing protein [Leptolyngbya sp. Prado105]|jgi:large exoprotein involved in heme utilization and adhesion|nr:filamentous hemagglutinin N-terminal domain-containing protein [Leptolyngbya sp. Prado105]
MTGGRAAQSNLFHSFGSFSVPTGGSATFNLIGTPNVANHCLERFTQRLDSSERISQAPESIEPLVEATNWRRNATTGKVQLIASQPTRSTSIANFASKLH